MCVCVRVCLRVRVRVCVCVCVCVWAGLGLFVPEALWNKVTRFSKPFYSDGKHLIISYLL